MFIQRISSPKRWNSKEVSTRHGPFSTGPRTFRYCDRYEPFPARNSDGQQKRRVNTAQHVTTVSYELVLSRRMQTQILVFFSHINFEIRAREGGILVLPHGASREDLISTVRLREYIQQHALNWYISMNKHPRTEINFPNGSLYVVTGCDKAHSWAIAAGPHSYLDMGRPFTINYRGDVSPAWRISAGIRCKSTKVVDDSQKYSVFLRGIKVAVSISDWTNYVLQNETPGRLPFYNVLGLRTTGLRAKLQSFIERKRHFPDHYLSPVSEVSGFYQPSPNTSCLTCH